jgi:competence protein ComEA
VGGDRTYATTLLIALAVLCLVVVSARWVVLAHRVPLNPLPATISAPANGTADNAATDTGRTDTPDTPPEAATVQAPAGEAAADGQAGQAADSGGSAASRSAATSSKQAQAPTAQRKLELNSATAAQLDLLPGIGPTLAQRIVDYRQQNGPFKRVEDLLNVNGIGEHKLADLRELVYVKPAQ